MREKNSTTVLQEQTLGLLSVNRNIHCKKFWCFTNWNISKYHKSVKSMKKEHTKGLNPK
ncbi:hypothetical protein GDO81_002580 [Engystomops pustulosus]|uniref:Uncharacterized protein n=1 Tax=Engystomops pustulosus TaxID=76066 RepID=A0AAV7DMF6_ENGPU|nr:hypothetical protein GDO81_002580 [Engystomops pustulosus]